MNENIVPLLRVLIIMATRDGQIHERERNYLDWTMEKYEIHPDTQAELRAELLDPPAVADVWPQIQSARDRAMLVDLLGVLMGIDGQVTAAERAFLDEVIALANPPTLGDSLVEHTNNILMWEDLKRLGLALKKRVSLWRRF